MAKNLKLTIKNTQIAKAVNLEAVKSKLASKKSASESQEQLEAKSVSKLSKKTLPEGEAKSPKEETPRIRARSKSVFAEPSEGKGTTDLVSSIESVEVQSFEQAEGEVNRDNFQEKIAKPSVIDEPVASIIQTESVKESSKEEKVVGLDPSKKPKEAEPTKSAVFVKQETTKEVSQPTREPGKAASVEVSPPPRPAPVREKLGPTGRHIKDLLPPPKPAIAKPKKIEPSTSLPQEAEKEDTLSQEGKHKPKVKRPLEAAPLEKVEEVIQEEKKGAKFKDFRDVKPVKRHPAQMRSFDSRDRQGLRETDEDQSWRRKRGKSVRQQEEAPVTRPTSLSVRLPISLKDLASEMKLKASQLIAKIFLQGIVVTINDILEDETLVQLLGNEFGCEITIDTSEEERIRVTDKSIKQEIEGSAPSLLKTRPPVVAFMGHVDHGKTSLIDAIRKSNRAAGEAGAITQHIGAFRCHTDVGDLTVLDTPGHEAFSSMRARGADVTDIVVLVVAGDEGIRQQTVEAIQHAKEANVTIIVALNKCDKPNFNAENVYRQLAEHELLPEAWGGQTITVNCSAATGEGIKTLLEMLALQTEVLELKANPSARARGTVLESELHKGMGSKATILVQNGTLRKGDALVFEQLWGRIKTIHDEFGCEMTEVPPSTPAEITGLSGLPEAGQEFIVVSNEKEARSIAEARMLGIRQVNLQKAKKASLENVFQQATETAKKILHVVLRADVQGSLEALKVALEKIKSTKAELVIISSGVGEIAESDVQLAAASKAVILGFHTKIESHADILVKQLGVQVRLHDIIYHAIDDIKEQMASLLDKIPVETDKGQAEVRAIFKSSQVGVVAGCYVTEGIIRRNDSIRVKRKGQKIWQGPIASLKRVKEDVREVAKGLECGILLNHFNDVQAGDTLEAFEVTYISQEL
ncbi:translation initiation factor IF-2 [Parachlamydia sp. AcF125]|uniref:translation initiation factor IF-2 n=1 Tax=Parachlamydia sp. AcF125 TaxID=2795736 RepID=UPI001BC93328|nr:translation initiation factor IF-2 [Parachlamydia sp. AcF125]MBS4168837.1 Translation initiation factor IF-2 [Parachlamydia sp. AcF125]